MASTGEVWKLGHRPALDGVRGIAILGVLACHARVPGMGAAGAVGVGLFFTLSGFLITALLLEEHARTGAIRFGAFYARRARRLLPAVLACVSVVLAVAAVAGSSFATPQGGAVALLYGSNWIAAAGLDLGALAHTWSLSIEEQFYLVWPLVVAALLARGRSQAIAALAVVGSAAAMVARVLLWDDGAGLTRVYYGTDTRADSLLLGCLLAAVMHGRHEVVSKPRLAVLAAAGMVPFCFATGFAEWVVLPGVVGVLAVALLHSVSQGGGVGWLEASPLTWLGRRSYGIYLWHWPIAVLVPDAPWFMAGPVMVAASLLVAELSWRLIERPFLRVSSRKPRTLGRRSIQRSRRLPEVARTGL